MNMTGAEVPRIKIEQKRPVSFETAKGSVYRYLPDGRTQRYKKAEGKEYEPQDVVVFIPDWNTLSKVASKEFLASFDNNPLEYEQTVIGYTHTRKKIYVVDQDGKKLISNADKASAKKLFAAFCGADTNTPDFVIPVSGEPKERFMVYDTRKYFDDADKQWKREQHVGNDVVKINY